MLTSLNAPSMQVTASGDLITADSSQNQDLLWAACGSGGGSLGEPLCALLCILPCMLGHVSCCGACYCAGWMAVPGPCCRAAQEKARLRATEYAELSTACFASSLTGEKLPP